MLLAFPLVLIAYHGLPIPLAADAAVPRGFVVALVLLLLTRALLRREGRRLSEFGLSVSARAGKLLAGGLLAGALLFATAAVLLRIALPFEWELNPTMAPMAIFGALIFHLVTNACEELAFRGYAFDSLLDTLGHWPAQGIIALAAAAFHLLSGWTWQVALVSTTAGSLLFGLTFLRWRSIPAAIGVHAAWNWTRDLILTASGSASVLEPFGTEGWSAAEWQVAQAILVGVTLAACAGLLWSLRKKEGTPAPPGFTGSLSSAGPHSVG